MNPSSNFIRLNEYKGYKDKKLDTVPIIINKKNIIEVKPCGDFCTVWVNKYGGRSGEIIVVEGFEVVGLMIFGAVKEDKVEEGSIEEESMLMGGV